MHKLLIPLLAATALAGNPGSSQAGDAAHTKIFKAGELIAVSSWLVAAGVRYLNSADKYNREAFSISRATQVSGLTEEKLTTHSADACWYVEPASATLPEGCFRGGLMIGNRLRREDFPPIIRLYATPLWKPEDSLLIATAVDQGYSVWKTPHYPLAAFVADPRWRERRAAFASTQMTINPDHCFTAPLSPAVTSFDNGATRDSLRLACGGVACAYTQPEAFGRCAVSRALSQHR
jgi:hypothetical protein